MSHTSPITSRRGFELTSFPGSMGIVLARAPVAEVSSTLQKIIGGTLTTDVYGRPIDDFVIGFGAFRIPVFQFVGHPWTLFLHTVCQPAPIRQLSRDLDTECICFEFEDTSGWTACALIDKGEVVENYRFGLDYSDEMEDLAEEMGEEVPESNDDGIPWDVNVSSDDGNQYLFRSIRRQATETQVQDSREFLDDFFRQNDAWLPEFDLFPFPLPDGTCGVASLAREDFVRVDILRQA